MAAPTQPEGDAQQRGGCENCVRMVHHQAPEVGMEHRDGDMLLRNVSFLFAYRSLRGFRDLDLQLPVWEGSQMDGLRAPIPAEHRVADGRRPTAAYVIDSA